MIFHQLAYQTWIKATQVGDWERGLTECQIATGCSEEIRVHTRCTVFFLVMHSKENFGFLGGFCHSFTFMPFGLQISEVFLFPPASLVGIQTVQLLAVTVGPF